MISIAQLGRIDYATGLSLQQKLVALRKEEKIGDVLLLLEHKPVITLGRNARAENVVASPELLTKSGVELFECDRGGDVTFHGPGQIVGYPIFDLRNYARVGTDAFVRPGESETRPVAPLRNTLGVIEFVRRLEDVLMRTCADFAIPTKRVQGLTGVWTEPNSPSSRADSPLSSQADSPLSSRATSALSSRAEENDSKNRSLESRDLGFADATKNHAGTAAPGRPVERISTAAANSASQSKGWHDREGHDFSRAKATLNREPASAAAPEAKLAAIGVHISRFVTSHGFALNVNTDLSYFNLIIPCGITSKPVTSMRQELGNALDLDKVTESISRNVGVVFQTQILWAETLDALLAGLCGSGSSTRTG